ELERARAKTLMEVAKEESRLATEIMLGREPADLVAAEERELRKDLLEIARMENAIAETMKADHTEDDAAAISVAEQAQRNRDLLRHVARTATEADRELRTGTREK
ncbi:MAG TPA: hypothetical protein VD902_11740, partial [Symbiobacteriaceae bacterium]|nr:hypothetical protein [Symbiobacteriaceae bacterium]